MYQGSGIMGGGMLWQGVSQLFTAMLHFCTSSKRCGNSIEYLVMMKTTLNDESLLFLSFDFF